MSCDYANVISGELGLTVIKEEVLLEGEILTIEKATGPHYPDDWSSTLKVIVWAPSMNTF